ncbi:MaoC family dehydratase [Litoribrevibacter albus]|uniref:Enoyl-CoA hydratase n=1 Tax=Litoribrevibacter albus TaxID=1473156 RepID=A0AA37S7M6_9GAMM|nr:MaoC family dehydratase [Litoribrevibacter albus]GLQ29753.1 enoyl-CoA hydratase [Litoribrevibacter albus]
MSKIRVGQKASVTRKFTEHDVGTFSELSLDFNPVHLDPKYAEQSMFGQRIVHGMLVSSLFSGLLGKHLPGEGTIYLGQDLKFTKPVYLDQEVTATVEVTEVRDDKPIITLSTTCINDEGDVVITGEAVVLYKG